MEIDQINIKTNIFMDIMGEMAVGGMSKGELTQFQGGI